MCRPRMRRYLKRHGVHHRCRYDGNDAIGHWHGKGCGDPALAENKPPDITEGEVAVDAVMMDIDDITGRAGPFRMYTRFLRSRNCCV